LRFAFSILLLLALLPACQQETRTVRQSSLASQFAQLNKDGWAVNGGSNQPGQKPINPNDPNVRVIKEANWSGLKFNTNFQVDDPVLRAQLEKQNQQNPQPAPTTPSRGFNGPPL